MKRLGLLGTGFTMAGTFYQEVFEKQHIDIVRPSDLRIAYLDTAALHIRAIVRETLTG